MRPLRFLRPSNLPAAVVHATTHLWQLYLRGTQRLTGSVPLWFVLVLAFTGCGDRLDPPTAQHMFALQSPGPLTGPILRAEVTVDEKDLVFDGPQRLRLLQTGLTAWRILNTPDVVRKDGWPTVRVGKITLFVASSPREFPLYRSISNPKLYVVHIPESSAGTSLVRLLVPFPDVKESFTMVEQEIFPRDQAVEEYVLG